MRRNVRTGTIRMKGLMQIRKPNGTAYWYVRVAGRPLVRMPDLPHDHPDFVTAWSEAWRLGPAERTPPMKAGTVAAMCKTVLASRKFADQGSAYQGLIKRNVAAIVDAYGTAPARGLRERHIQKDVSGAGVQLGRLKTWRFICAAAKEAGLLESDPSRGVTAHRQATVGHEPWTADDVTAFRKRWSVGTSARAAMELLHWTGARISDAVLIGPQHIDRQGVLSFVQVKTGDPAFVPWHCALPEYAVLMEADRAEMFAALISTGHLTFLATEAGRTRSEKALGTMIRLAARDAGIEKSAHGLRKARAISLAEAGATVHQIAAWTGHKTLKEIENYTKKAERRRAVMGSSVLTKKSAFI